jgi:hypothetical protein
MLAPDLDERHVFLCGPEPFAAEVKKSLQELNFNFANFHAESFGTGRVARGVKGNAKSLQLSEPRHRVRFTKSDISVETDETVNLLELAEAHGIEIEYACRSGSCGACEVRFPESFRRRRISKRRHSAKKAALPSPVAALPSRISRWMLDGGWIAVPGLRALADSNDRSWRTGVIQAA